MFVLRARSLRYCLFKEAAILTPVITEAFRRSPVKPPQCANYWFGREKCGIFVSVCAVVVSIVLCTQVRVS